MKDKLTKKIFLIAGIIAVLGVASSSVVLSSPASAQKGPEFIPGRYIVVLQDGVSPQDVIRGHGMVPNFVYSHALNGFSAPLSPAALAELKQDSRVKYVEQVQKLSFAVQDIPTGIDRIDAEPGTSTSSYAGDVTVAIIDSGIADHLDLNVAKKVNCANKGPRNQECIEGEGDDANGHGTHVAGTVAAIDDTEGVVGVAPGADLWAMKVFKDDGSGWTSWSIAALDYIIGQGGVDVVNMSLTSSTSQAVNDAVKRTYDAGIVVVVAAGNQMSDASTRSPASAPEAITVSAIADFNGRGGGGSDQTVNFSICTEDTDDSFACFSNFGSLIDIAAPGVLILSTWNNGGYATISGTSMASPHVAGAAAKIIADARNLVPSVELTPQQVLHKLVTEDSIKAGETDYFTGDVDAFAEPLLYVGGETDETSPEITTISYIATSNSATITWSTDEPATSFVDYGINDAYGSSVSDSTHVTSHSVKITGLTPKTTYHFKVTSVDPSGNSASSVDYQFTTSASATLDSISVTPVNPSITVGSTQQFTATGTYSDDVEEDLTQVVTWTSSTVAATIDATGKATGESEGQTTIKAEINGLEDFTTLDVTPAPVNPTDVVVSSVTYGGEGGKNKDKHLLVFVTLKDNFGDPVSGASVSSQLFRNGGSMGTATGTTSTDGIVAFTLKNAPSGTYTTTVTKVLASGLTWDGVTPPNSHTK